MRRNLSQAVAAELLLAIEIGEYGAGDKLPPEHALMERFGVGRNTLREAVQSLVSQGLLDVRPGRGTTVVGVDGRTALGRQGFSSVLAQSAVDDLYEFRLLLETDAAAKAAERAGAGEKSSIRNSLEAYHDAVKSGVDTHLRDVEFHAAISHASGNSAYVASIEALANVLSAVRSATDQVPGATARALVEHTQIAEFIEQGDPIGARAAMVIHLQTARSTLAAARAQSKHGDG